MRKMTRKDVKNEYKNIIRVGYCDLDYTCRRLKEVGYNYGVYGWNFTCYEVDYDTCIVTGYRNLIGNIKLNSDDIEILENRCKIRNQSGMPYPKQCEAIIKDIQTLVKEGAL